MILQVTLEEDLSEAYTRNMIVMRDWSNLAELAASQSRVAQQVNKWRARQGNDLTPKRFFLAGLRVVRDLKTLDMGSQQYKKDLLGEDGVIGAHETVLHFHQLVKRLIKDLGVFDSKLQTESDELKERFYTMPRSANIRSWC
ncbi:hypothetical protein JKP88DRAFT_289728 [Tribonema minus]|uniref:Uncharacterized protein n=1 Tax=Tribonema minus TaxID=303371 RepID=A0A835YZZ9_9STRA|nr:hypothetical protein JKP88DRAFT_289728 [Tribonema minus]